MKGKIVTRSRLKRHNRRPLCRRTARRVDHGAEYAVAPDKRTRPCGRPQRHVLRTRARCATNATAAPTVTAEPRAGHSSIQNRAARRGAHHRRRRLEARTSAAPRRALPRRLGARSLAVRRASRRRRFREGPQNSWRFSRRTQRGDGTERRIRRWPGERGRGSVRSACKRGFCGHLKVPAATVRIPERSDRPDGPNRTHVTRPFPGRR